MSDLDLSVCDLQFRDKIHYIYERDDGLVRCWIDHILCSRVKEFSISNILLYLRLWIHFVRSLSTFFLFGR